MTLKALSLDVRSILCASAQINNYKTAIAELVYNSLDAESTSIAIRVHIQEDRLQVIDNGCGIIKSDFEALGQRYMTSKVTDIATLKWMPKYYGYRGEFLANLIEISHCVNITSRHKDGEETWAQTFYKNRKKELLKVNTRPSTGTTVDVKGFLYNLNIQKRAINPLNDLQNIKAFLEQICVVHNDISISLRDDSKNDIIFKIHKNRNVYQTLKILFDINQTDIQELQVEKNQYKVKAYIGKKDNVCERHWIYINGKLVQSFSRLHRITNEYFRKHLRLPDIRKPKYRNNYAEEQLFQSNIPFYFILITCPYSDYDISFTLCQSLVEFRNWKQIKIILEKVIKFYVGDINLKEMKRSEENVILHHTKEKNNADTRHQIKEIVDKILGNNSKKIRVSQLHNGIKGRLVKRKKKAKNKEVSRGKSFPKIDKIQQRSHDANASNIAVPDINPNNKNEKHLLIDQTRTNTNNHKKIVPISKNNLVNLRENKIETYDSIIKNRIQTSKIKTKKRKRPNKTNYMSKEKLVPKPKETISCKLNKKCKLTGKNRKVEVYQFLKETDTIPQKTKIVAQEVKAFLNSKTNDVIINKLATNRHKGVNHAFTKNKHHSKNLSCKVPLLSKVTKNIIDNNLIHKIERNSFKTTYDLVQTILENPETQGKEQYNQTQNGWKKIITDHSIINYKHVLLNHMFPQYYNSYTQEQLSKFYKIPNKFEPYQPTYGSTYSLSIDKRCEISNTYNFCKPRVDLSSRSLRCEDIFKDFQRHITETEPSSYLSDIPTVAALTYQSHNYNNYNYLNTQTCVMINQNKNCSVSKSKTTTRFITNQSQDNFIHKRVSKNYVKDKFNEPTTKQTQFYSEPKKQMLDKSYTIDFTTSNEINYSFKHDRVSKGNQHEFQKPHIQKNKHSVRNLYLPSNKPIMDYGNTYTICTSSASSVYNATQPGLKYTLPNEIFVPNSVHCSNIDNEDLMARDVENNENKDNQDNHNTSSNFKLASFACRVNMDEDLQPLDFCETVFHEHDSIEREFAFSFHRKSKSNDSLYNNNSNIDNINKYPTQNMRHQNTNENVSHHFNNTLNANNVNNLIEISDQLPQSGVTNVEDNIAEHSLQRLNDYNIDDNKDIEDPFIAMNDKNFNFKDRLRFLPKGMSQIFEKSGSKAICDYNLDKDYYEDVIYNDFANDIEMQTEVYEPVVQNIGDLATKDIQKFQIKVNKDNTSLFFDETSLKEARVLNQVDCKFIATIMRGRNRGSETVSDYLILFDQHAVHERIRLEKNLAGYFTGDKWRSVPLDNMTLKMSKDEIIYLHNYKDKFNQLGLQWSILDKDKISISSIPEAILGKNPREVDKVMKAVKYLIMEEINVIKLQKGCISLYPKSIMDLVFSEACRYAIKFGDKLSKSDCTRLFDDLSNCKTPFQCAHGRPVMAVLLDINNTEHDYKINLESLSLFKLKRKTYTKK